MAYGNHWLSMRGLAAFAGGAVAAILASRVLPPIAAQAAGTARVAAGHDPFEVMMADHRRILGLLERMEQSTANGAFNRIQLLLRLKRELAAHAMAEEDVIYPLVHTNAIDKEEARRLYQEHADMKMHLFALEQLPKDDPRWLEMVRGLKTIIEAHVRQEEDVEFPRLRAAMDHQAAARLAGSIQRERAMVL